jgi:hypothetical protein
MTPHPYRRGTFTPVLLGAVALLLVGCGQPFDPFGPGSHVCTAIAIPGVAVDVRDSVTNAHVGRGARIVATSGRFADTLRVPADSDYEGAYGLATERPGVYTVTVEREGYRPWSRTGIRVDADECHVRTVSVVARLQR